jgi:hypothetical protein
MQPLCISRPPDRRGWPLLVLGSKVSPSIQPGAGRWWMGTEDAQTKLLESLN